MDGRLLILSRNDVSGLMRPADYLAAVEAGFQALAKGRADAPPPLHMPLQEGGFHAKGAWFDDGRRTYAALKFNANFPHNYERFGLPTIQGAIILSDAKTGAPLAVIDSIEVTLRRTAAASALAARLLARPDSKVIAVCGCGAQGRAHLEALAEVLPLDKGVAWDRDFAKAEAFAHDMRASLGIDLRAAASHREATLEADVIVTCTTAQSPFLTPRDVRPGVFIAAVGADAPHKSEIDPALMASAEVFVDVLAQCLDMGDLRHAVSGGAMAADDVRGDLAGLVSGASPGRSAADEIIVFDSTGTAIEDAASAAVIYTRARECGAGIAAALT